MNLITTYKNMLKSRGISLDECLKVINKRFNMKIQKKHFAEFESGKRSIKPEIINYLSDMAHEYVLDNVLCVDDDLDVVFDNYKKLMQIPKRKR